MLKHNDDFVTTFSSGKTAFKPIRSRLMLPLIAVILLLIIGLAVTIVALQRNSLNESRHRIMNDVMKDITLVIGEQSKALNAISTILLNDVGLRDALKRQDRQGLLASYGDIFAELRASHDITHFYFHSPDRVNLLRIHKSEMHGDLINRFTAIEAERTAKTASGIELGPLGTFTLRVVQPVFDGDTLVGYMELGKEIEDILNHVYQKTGIEMMVTIHKSALDQAQQDAHMEMLDYQANWDNDALIYSTLSSLSTRAGSLVIHNGHIPENIFKEIVFDGKTWRVLVSPLADVSGTVVGNLVLLYNISKAAAAFNRQIIAISGGAFVLLAGLLSFLYILICRTDLAIRNQHEHVYKMEAFQRTLLGALPDFIFILDAKGVIQKVNRVYSGYREENVVGQKALMFITPRFQGAFKEAFRQAIDTGRLQTVITDVDLPTGYHYFLTRLNPVVLSAEENSVVFVATDITKHMQAEENMKTLSAQLQLIFDATPAYIWFKDTKNRILKVNKSAAETLGMAVEDIEGKYGHELFSAEDAERFYQEDLEIIRTGQPKLGLIIKQPLQSGGHRWIRADKIPHFDEKGNVVGLIIHAQDITKQREMEEQIRETE